MAATPEQAKEICDDLAKSAIELFASFLSVSTDLDGETVNFTDGQAFELTRSLMFDVMRAEDAL